MFKPLLLLLGYSIGIGELALGIFFHSTNSGSNIRKVMALLCTSTGLWVFISVFVAYKPDSTINHFLTNLVFILGVLLLTTLLHLTILFPIPQVQFNSLHIILLYQPVLIFTAIIFWF